MLDNQETTNIWYNDSLLQIVREMTGNMTIISNEGNINANMNSIMKGDDNIRFNTNYIISILWLTNINKI